VRQELARTFVIQLLFLGSRETLKHGRQRLSAQPYTVGQFSVKRGVTPINLETAVESKRARDSDGEMRKGKGNQLNRWIKKMLIMVS